MWTVQKRLNDCYRQLCSPEPKFGSNVTIALSVYRGVYRGVNAQVRRIRCADHQALIRRPIHEKYTRFALVPVSIFELSAYSTGVAGGANYDKMFQDVVAGSFQPNGIATIDYRKPDSANNACAAADVAGKPLDDKMVQAIEAAEI